MLDADNAAFIQTSVSISLATCGVDHLPNLMRAVGCKLLDGGRRVGIFLNATLAPALLADVRANRRVACVFCLPSSNRTLQLKGDHAIGRRLDLGAGADGDGSGCRTHAARHGNVQFAGQSVERNAEEREPAAVVADGDSLPAVDEASSAGMT